MYDSTMHHPHRTHLYQTQVTQLDTRYTFYYTLDTKYKLLPPHAKGYESFNEHQLHIQYTYTLNIRGLTKSTQHICLSRDILILINSFYILSFLLPKEKSSTGAIRRKGPDKTTPRRADERGPKIN